MSNGQSRAEYTVRVERRRLILGDGTLTETSHLVSHPSSVSWDNEHGLINFATEEFVGAAVVKHDGSITAYLCGYTGTKDLGPFATPEAGVEAVIDFSRARREDHFAKGGRW